MENIKRIMNNLCVMPAYIAMLSTKEVDYWLDNYSDTVLCGGYLRQVVFEPITDKHYKVYTKKIR